MVVACRRIITLGGERGFKTMKKGLFFLPMLALLFWSQVGWTADSIGNTFGLGPRVGYYRSKDAAEGSWYGGLQARFRFGEYFGLEGAVDYRMEETFDVDAPGFSGEIAQHSYPVTASLMIFLPILPHFSPYVVGGGGYYFTKIDYSESLEAIGFDDQTEKPFGWHAGAGLEFPFTEHAALNFDFRWIFMDSEFGTSAGTDLDEDRTADGYAATAAVMFYF
jgi:opacity protein-like surface antigen